MKVTCIMRHNVIERGQSRVELVELKPLLGVGSRLHRVVRVGPMEQKQGLEGCEMNQQVSGEDILISCRVMGQSKGPSQKRVGCAGNKRDRRVARWQQWEGRSGCSAGGSGSQWQRQKYFIMLSPHASTVIGTLEIHCIAYPLHPLPPLRSNYYSCVTVISILFSFIVLLPMMNP